MIERFTDLLDIAIINMKENDESDLNSSFMYIQLMKKLPDSMISRFQRWLFENEKEETIGNLKEWVVQESDFHVIAMEMKFGLDHGTTPQGKKESSFFNKNSKENFVKYVMENMDLENVIH